MTPDDTPRKDDTLKPDWSWNRIIRYAGFCCALAATALLLFISVDRTLVLGELSLPIPILAGAFSMLLLLLAARLNDFLITTKGLSWLKVMVLIGGFGSFSLIFSGFSLIGALAVALFSVTSILLWGSSLAYYERSELLLTTATSFLVTGVLLAFMFYLNAEIRLLLSCTLALASGLFVFFGNVNPKIQQTGISIAVSRSHALSGRGNRSTIVSIGMSVGIVIVMGFFLAQHTLLIASIIGCIVAIASLLTVLLRTRFKHVIEEFARRSIGAVTVITILPYPFVALPIQVVCMCALLILVTANSIILIDAIAETARLKQISPIWIVGSEGSFFLLGSLIAQGVFLFCLGASYEMMLASCIIFSIIFVALQVFVEEQTYPYFDIISSEDSEGSPDESKEFDSLFESGGGKWRKRLDEVAAEYRLSPRQQEVMRLLLKGRDARYMMNKFVISQATAKTHVYNLYKKLGVHSRHELLDLIERKPS